jgi:hypothetical protein
MNLTTSTPKHSPVLAAMRRQCPETASGVYDLVAFHVGFVDASGNAMDPVAGNLDAPRSCSDVRVETAAFARDHAERAREFIHQTAMKRAARHDLAEAIEFVLRREG